MSSKPIPPVLVQGDTLVCPHCKNAELDEFLYLEDVQNYRELKRLKGGLLVIESYYKVFDESGNHNPRLLCKKCDNDCTIPDTLEYDWE